MSAALFRIGIIGTGMITLSSHLPACLASPNIEVTALIDPVLERAREAASKFGIAPLVTTRVEDALEEIDGAIIATPNGTHCELALTCLAAGIDILIDKPMAASADEGERIIKAARLHDRVAAVGYCTRFRNNLQLLKRLLDERYFGRVLRFAHQFGTDGGWAPFSAYNLSRAGAGGGVLVVTGSHFIDRLVWFWGMPSHVALKDDSLGGPEANCVADFYWDDQPNRGLRGVARYSKTTALPGGLVLDTEAGIVKLGDSDEAEIRLLPIDRADIEMVIRQSSVTGSSPPRRSVFELQVEEFVEACRERRKPFVDATDALLSQRLFERLYVTRLQMGEDWYLDERREEVQA